ncbi:hypothetical protein Tco_0602723, partial [Tanacetum coccineum]
MCNEKGERFEKEDVAEQFVKHFKDFLGKQDEVNKFPVDKIVFSSKLTNEEAEDMVKPISEAEIKNALFDIDDSKAPGLDGVTA